MLKTQNKIDTIQNNESFGQEWVVTVNKRLTDLEKKVERMFILLKKLDHIEDLIDKVDRIENVIGIYPL